MPPPDESAAQHRLICREPPGCRVSGGSLVSLLLHVYLDGRNKSQLLSSLILTETPREFRLTLLDHHHSWLDKLEGWKEKGINLPRKISMSHTLGVLGIRFFLDLYELGIPLAIIFSAIA